MSEPLKLLIVEDQIAFSKPFISALQSGFANADITLATNLADARLKLKNNIFSGIIMDCGFPSTSEEIREKGNRNGIVLIGEIRRGAYGPENAIVPIAFNSVEMEREKSESALRCGGNTKAFRKGGFYGVQGGSLETNFTSENITNATVRWLKEELTETKVSKRRLALLEASVKKDSEGGFMQQWFGFSSGGVSRT